MRFDPIWQDLVLAWRNVVAKPSYAVVVLITLALGIAANTMIVSFMNPYFIRPLPFRDAYELVQIGQVDTLRGWDGARFSIPQVEDWRARSRAFRELGTYYYTTKNVTGTEGPESLLAGVLSENLFGLLGVPPRLGRTFEPGDSEVVVLSDGLWRRRYGADPAILGTVISLDGIPHSVIGVMPPAFNFPFGGVKMWIPLPATASAEPRDRDLHILVGRLNPEWTRERARVELEGIQSELSATYPDIDGQFSGVSVKELREALNFGYDIMRASFTVFLAAVGFILLIACVNVASLTLARARARERDVAVRSALGARRGHIVRQLLTESLLLALLGGGLGVFLADWGARAIAPLVPEDIFRVGEVELDTRVLLFSVALTLLTPVLFGLAPAIGISRTNLVSSLRQGVRAGGAGIGSMRVRRALVVLEVTLAIALVVGTGLMVRSFFELQKVELGFRPEAALTVRLALPQTDYPEASEQKLFFDRALLEVSSLPGARAAGYTVPLPMNHAIWTVQFALPDDAPAARENWPLAHQFNVSSRYFEAMGVALLAGRTFDERDGPNSARVVIVSRSTADAYWPDRNAVGESLLVVDSEGTFEATVVGVVADVRHEGFQDEIGAQIYQAIDQGGFRGRFLVVSAGADPENLTRAVAGAIAAVDPNLPVEIRPMADIVSESALQWTISSILLGVFGAVALLLASLGIYGVVAFTVAERRREIGIRMALGATSREIGALVLGEGLKLTAAGIALGIVLAGIAARLVASQLFGVSPFDPVTFVVATGLFIATSAFASLAPTLRASSTNPIAVLRHE